MSAGPSATRDGAPPPVVAEGVTRRFGPYVVLRDLDVRLEWGEAAALVAAMRRKGRRGALVVAAAVALVGLLACDTRPRWDREPVGRRYFDSTETYVHAGVSARTHVDIEPLRPSTLKADTASSSFHLLQMRCAACHDAPDPTMKTARGWSYLIGRMQDKTRTAGVIPMTDAEANSILALLRKYARSQDELRPEDGP